MGLNGGFGRATSFNDTLSGNRADNRFYLHSGDHRVNGRFGQDDISFYGTDFDGFAGVVVDLRAGTATGAGAKVPVSIELVSIEAVTGSALDDHLLGKGNSNGLRGGSGHDRIAGRRGDDVLSGDAGNDTLTGGAGADVFAFLPGAGRDEVTDFAPGEDRIALHNYGFTTAAEVLARAHQEKAATVFTFVDGSEWVLRHVQLSDLSAGDFLI